MADNYLEKLMEDYRNGRLGRPSVRRAAVGGASDHNHVRALVIGGETIRGRETVKLLRGYGWQVAFTDPDIKHGRELAQMVGAQHHPIEWSDAGRLLRSIDEIEKRWGGLDVVVSCVGAMENIVAKRFDAGQTMFFEK